MCDFFPLILFLLLGCHLQIRRSIGFCCCCCFSFQFRSTKKKLQSTKCFNLNILEIMWSANHPNFSAAWLIEIPRPQVPRTPILIFFWLPRHPLPAPIWNHVRPKITKLFILQALQVSIWSVFGQPWIQHSFTHSVPQSCLGLKRVVFKENQVENKF